MGVASDADGTPGTAPLGLLAVVKGKRSKRHRGYVTVDSPPRVPEASRSFSDADEVAAGYGTEEEDMAHCLMLLAHGRVGSPETEAAKEDKFRSRRSADGGELVYECKTCNKCFPSFQALGGHRTSHKKPRLRPPPPAAAVQAEEEKPQASTSWTVPSKPVVASDNVNTGNSSKSRTHECSICGAEFASGQALGGHMRRHRPLVQSPERKEKVLLELDLNLPASCDGGGGDVMASSFVFDAAAEMERLFPAPASALVDCHY